MVSRELRRGVPRGSVVQAVACREARKPHQRVREPAFDRVVEELAAGTDDIVAEALDRLDEHGRSRRRRGRTPLRDVLSTGMLAAVQSTLVRLGRSDPPSRTLPARTRRMIEEWTRHQDGSVVVLLDLVAIAYEVLAERLDQAAEKAEPDAERRWLLAGRFRASLATHARGMRTLVCAASEDGGGPRRGKQFWIQRVLNGEIASCQQLGYDLSGYHTALVCLAPDSREQLRVVAANRSLPILLFAGADGTTTGWLASRHPLPSSDLDEIARTPAVTGRETGMGECLKGADGFRETYRQAVEARTFLATNERGVVRYRDISLLAMLGDNPRVLQAFTERELPGLTGMDLRSAQLRRTLRTYLERGQSTKATGAALQLHRETVRHQLSAVEQRLGHAIAERSGELLVALKLFAVHGQTHAQAA